MFSEEKKERIKEKTEKLRKEGWEDISIARLFGLHIEFLQEIAPVKKAKKRDRSK